ncbi:Late embryogenesis abundant protein [Quillaja saponaria]|uniref:Late embryogenesis abundant protein n=1 Tax=Quillaja saponaria TaxID=32244 RepID=A0AAD7LSY3_QUISA|nr:Late embryogenesis abundant protein [Quillaja saponaria]
MEEQGQVKLPQPPAADLPSSDDDEAAQYLKKLRRRKCMIKCCGCITVFLQIKIIVIVILIFTLFRIKNPFFTLNGFTINKFPTSGTNMSITAVVSVKNPNMAPFRFSNTTTNLYYYGMVAGEAKAMPGNAKARRTFI